MQRLLLQFSISWGRILVVLNCHSYSDAFAHSAPLRSSFLYPKYYICTSRSPPPVWDLEFRGNVDIFSWDARVKCSVFRTIKSVSNDSHHRPVCVPSLPPPGARTRAHTDQFSEGKVCPPVNFCLAVWKLLCSRRVGILAF